MKKIILTPNPYRDKNFQTVRTALEILNDAGMEARVCLPFEVDRTYDLPKDIRFSRLDRELPTASMVVCFGGDGTILHMAKAATRYNIPILGVNIGTMGFMAELEATELDQLKRIAAGDYTIDHRMMLDVTVMRDRDIIFHDICLNDVVITKGAVARIVHLAVDCDGVQAMECGGDGVIVATPTGSTAYSLSAGGPIVEPEAHSILVTPICAHDVASRCMVASDRRVINVSLIRNSRRNAFLSVDGGKALRLNMGDIVTRQAKILEIISTQNIETQEQLLAVLQAQGFRGTQATISRDIKELRIVKELTNLGTYRYTTSSNEVSGSFSAKLNTIFRECVIGFDYAQNIIVIRTLPGLASAAGSAIDAMNLNLVVGTLAGDDTVMVVMRDNNAAAAFCGEIRSLIN